jgi:uncharacterized membrane protein YphA (DoxX/SURF4 family)
MRYVKTVTVLLWIVQILAALAFVAIGFGKFTNVFWIKAFPRWGYSDGFRMLIGVLEMVGGAVLVFPRATTYAAILLDTILVGAAATLLVHHEKPFPPLFWLVVISILGVVRRRQAWRPAAPSVPATGRV